MESLLGLVGIKKNTHVEREYQVPSTEISDGIGPITTGQTFERVSRAIDNVQVTETKTVHTNEGLFSSLFGTKKIDHIEARPAVGITSSFDEKDIIVEKTPVVHETIITEQVEEIQPIIHREIEQPEIHRVTQPFFERIFRGTAVSEKELNAEYRADVVAAPSADFIAKRDAVGDRSSVDYTSTKTVIEKEPIIYEHRIRSIIEEIQPIIHREVVQPEVVKETLNIYEKYIEAPIIIEETREPKIVYTDRPVEIRKI